MSEEWQQFGSKKMKMSCEGKVVLVAPSDNESIVPLFCPCCQFPMRDVNDSMSFRKVGVCSSCDNRWTNKPGIEWPKGPDKNSDAWQEYIEQRAKLSRSIITLE